jgi:hypothetical protein
MTRAMPDLNNLISPSMPGDKMSDGTIYVGTSPDTGKAMYTTPTDAPKIYTYNQAQNYASSLEAHGHRDWRIPTKAELRLLFDKRLEIGGFDLTGSKSTGWYWSSTIHNNHNVWRQRFSDGKRHNYRQSRFSSLRCVR